MDTRTLAPPQYELFISYADVNRDWVESFLIPELRVPKSRIITPDTLELSVSLPDAFEQAVRSSRCTVVVLTEAYLNNVWNTFSDELTMFAGREGREGRLVPLMLEPCTPPWRVGMLVQLNCTDRQAWDREIARLRKHLGRRKPARKQVDCPYPGAVAFGAPGDTDFTPFFHGRDQELKRALNALRDQRLIFLIGPSGCGKSSLVHAGLLPALADTDRFPAGYWVTREFRPGDRPAEKLAGALGGEVDQPDHAVAAILAAHPPAQRLLLVIDQFEEVFAVAPPEEQHRFFVLLGALRAVDRCTVVATLRADFEDRLTTSALWSPAAGRVLNLSPLTGDALRDAIVLPAKDKGVVLESALVERLLADAAGRPGSMSLIQVTMQRLWPHLKQGWLDLSDYNRLGRDGQSGLANALADHASDVLGELSAGQQQIARRVLLALVQLGSSTSGGGRVRAVPDTRRQMPVARLRSPRDRPGDFDRTLDTLSRGRLVIFDGDAPLGPVVDLAHEVLLTGWPQLHAWLEQVRPDLPLHRQLSGAAEGWLAHGRDQSYLFTGLRLDEAKGFATRHANLLCEPEEEFLSAGDVHEAARQAREQMHARARRRLEMLGGTVGGALGYGLAFAVLLLFDGQGPVFGFITFLLMCAFGALVGWCIGAGPWLARRGTAAGAGGSALAAAVAGSAAYVLFQVLMFGSAGLRDAATGALLGGGIGLGAGVAMEGNRRVLTTILGGLVAAELVAVTAVGGPAWSVPVAAACGTLLGGATGIGLHLASLGPSLRRGHREMA